MIRKVIRVLVFVRDMQAQVRVRACINLLPASFHPNVVIRAV